MTRKIQIGLLGCGVVGTGVLRLLHDHAQMIEAKIGGQFALKHVVVRDPHKARDAVVPAEVIGTNAMRLAEDPDIDIVVEVMGGLDPAEGVLRAALEQGKHVVTANKALVAERGDELLELAEARRVDLYFEAAVAGGIPILRVLREGLASDRITALSGIVNGTSNYILSQMAAQGCEFADALQAAQAAGYAEADPTLDISGGDAGHKLAILATLAFGARLSPAQIPTEGIDQVARVDLQFAERFGFTIKPLAVARELPEGLDLRVHPALVPHNQVLANIHDALNAIYLEGAMVGPCLLSGLGAGALPTATSVVSDLVDVGRNLLVGAHGRVPSRAFRAGALQQRPIRPLAEHRGRYYLRFTVHDQPGVLASIAGVLGTQGVSIEQMVQQGHEPDANVPVHVVVLTHTAREAQVSEALCRINELPAVVQPTCRLRVEDR